MRVSHFQLLYGITKARRYLWRIPHAQLWNFASSRFISAVVDFEIYDDRHEWPIGFSPGFHDSLREDLPKRTEEPLPAVQVCFEKPTRPTGAPFQLRWITMSDPRAPPSGFPTQFSLASLCTNISRDRDKWRQTRFSLCIRVAFKPARI